MSDQKTPKTPWGLGSIVGTAVAFFLAGDIVVLCYAQSHKSLALMAAIALTVAGMIIGFLFGIPKTLQNTQRKSGSAGEEKEPGFEANTNLEQISDWLTKILVGAGLVEFREIKSTFHSVAQKLGPAISSEPGAEVFAEFMMIYFLIAGFLACYLLTRTYLPQLFSRATAEKFAEVEHKVQEISTKVANIFESDPHKGNFGGKSAVNGRRLSATVSPDRNSSENFIIDLKVESDDPKNPLTKPVVFYLHPTYAQSMVWRDPENGVATLQKQAWGAFTVGVEIVDEKIRLELDLSELPGAPEKFKSR